MTGGVGDEEYTVDWSLGSEEPWEQQISSLLGSLPPVEPPAGFLETLAVNGPTIDAPFTLSADEMFSFPVLPSPPDRSAEQADQPHNDQ